jgi:membrane protein DedA with SNARE-associated domain
MLDATTALSLLAGHGYWFVYLGTVLFGEVTIVASFILGSQGVLNMALVFLLAILGTMTTDHFWFAVGTVAAGRGKRVINPERLPRVFRIIDQLLARFLLRHPVVALTISKFIIGGRILTILYLTQKQVPLRRFIFSDFVAVTSFAAVLAGVGWASGKGVHALFPSQSILAITLGALVLALMVLWGSEKFFSKELEETL